MGVDGKHRHLVGRWALCLLALSSCGPRPPIGPEYVIGQIGSSHPLVLKGFSRRGLWTTYCQARKDTDQNGKIRLESGYHGELFGDQLDLYVHTPTWGEEPLLDYLGGGETSVVVENKAGVWWLRPGDRRRVRVPPDAKRWLGRPMVSVDAAGERLFMLRGSGAVWLTLDGSEHPLDHGTGQIEAGFITSDGKRVAPGCRWCTRPAGRTKTRMSFE